METTREKVKRLRHELRKAMCLRCPVSVSNAIHDVEREFSEPESKILIRSVRGGAHKPHGTVRSFELHIKAVDQYIRNINKGVA